VTTPTATGIIRVHHFIRAVRTLKSNRGIHAKLNCPAGDPAVNYRRIGGSVNG
jgi:hypothetical protein